MASDGDEDYEDYDDDDDDDAEEAFPEPAEEPSHEMPAELKEQMLRVQDSLESEAAAAREAERRVHAQKDQERERSAQQFARSRKLYCDLSGIQHAAKLQGFIREHGSEDIYSQPGGVPLSKMLAAVCGGCGLMGWNSSHMHEPMSGLSRAESEVVSWAHRVCMPEVFVLQLVVSYIHVSAVQTASEAARWWCGGAAQVKRRIGKVHNALRIDLAQPAVAQEARDFLGAVYVLGTRRGLSVDLCRNILSQLAHVEPITIEDYRRLYRPIRESRLERARDLFLLTNEQLRVRMEVQAVRDWCAPDYTVNDYMHRVSPPPVLAFPQCTKVNQAIALIDSEDGLVPLPPRHPRWDGGEFEALRQVIGYGSLAGGELEDGLETLEGIDDGIDDGPTLQ